MKITARCHPALRPLLPAPVPANDLMPQWFTEMPRSTVSPTLGGAEVATLRQCPPLGRAFGAGVLMLNAVDLTLQDGALSWDWDPPLLPDTGLSRAPVGLHVPEQAEGAPFATDHLILRFTNFWRLETEPGWSLLVLHPVGHPDLPFRTQTGVVDHALLQKDYVHFPAHLSPDTDVTIPKGTPIAQLVPVRAEVTLEVGELPGQD